MVTRDDLTKAIEPGSTEFGTRDDLEAGLEAAVPDPSSALVPQTTGPGTPPLPVDSVDDPLAALISGSIVPPDAGGEITAGLSVGPGPGPQGQTAPADPKMVRLQKIAMQARSPLIRHMARNELRRMVGESV